MKNLLPDRGRVILLRGRHSICLTLRADPSASLAIQRCAIDVVLFRPHLSPVKKANVQRSFRSVSIDHGWLRALDVHYVRANGRSYHLVRHRPDPQPGEKESDDMTRRHNVPEYKQHALEAVGALQSIDKVQAAVEDDDHSCSNAAPGSAVTGDVFRLQDHDEDGASRQ